MKNYKALWVDCKNNKAREEKLLDLLRERGLKGKPSVHECRKIKKKYEREKEVSELNTSNIITSNGLYFIHCTFLKNINFMHVFKHQGDRAAAVVQQATVKTTNPVAVLLKTTQHRTKHHPNQPQSLRKCLKD